MKALIVRSNMKLESHLYLLLFQSYRCFRMYHFVTIEFVGTGDKIVHFKLV